ncbi:MAG: asparagine synthase (glutamine-hydrolyzing) [Acidobacteria bacterium]|nr:MAG: asparagine synthase (glutamine-hydrolyzing) [Acidobacteriota bacterium]REK07290.1 MAG: asparagine synthase (glutamine-hydrolyzing) [Acidobacteriota bacterium]
MCGFAGLAGAVTRAPTTGRALAAMSAALVHRGPDDQGSVSLPDFAATHRRLSILDLSASGHQPMARGPLRLVYNGEIYNHEELRRELRSHGQRFAGSCDTEVLLAAWQVWGENCLDRLHGMFAFAVWDERDRSLVLVRDRFGVKPLYWANCGASERAETAGAVLLPTGSSADGVAFASEIAALQAIGLGVEPEPMVWARFLADGAAERGRETFWRGIERLGAGEMLRLQGGHWQRRRWYDVAERALAAPPLPREECAARLLELLDESVRLRFRSDVPVAVNLSGGLDSSLLFALVQRAGVDPSRVPALTFTTGDERYDELPWVEAMLHGSSHPHLVVRMEPQEVPDLARRISRVQSEPAGGLPTLAYAKLFQHASSHGIKVTLDGQGMDEAWAGYDYYRGGSASPAAPALQGSRERSTRPEVVDPQLARAAAAFSSAPAGEAGGEERPGARPCSLLQRRQLEDLVERKLPRALRYNDRVSMAASVELREPFLDHRLVELGLAQPDEHKVGAGGGKLLVRELTARLLPERVREAPKRPLQTPQREWLRGPLRAWAEAGIEEAARCAWLDGAAVRREWRRFADGVGDNSFFIWQWIDLSLLVGDRRTTAAQVAEWR